MFDRNDVFDILRRAYDYGSQAVHAGAIKPRRRDDAAATIRKAQDICRHAIAKRLWEGEPKGDYWKRLVLQTPPEPEE